MSKVRPCAELEDIRDGSSYTYQIQSLHFAWFLDLTGI